MARNTNTYAQGQVSVVVGVLPLRGWRKIVVARDNPRYTFQNDANGGATRSRSGNLLGSIVITMRQGSPKNLLLSALETSGLLVPCLVKDNNGFSLHIMPEATIEGPPEVTYDEESGEIEWTLRGIIPDPYVVGGNV